MQPSPSAETVRLPKFRVCIRSSEWVGRGSLGPAARNASVHGCSGSPKLASLRTVFRRAGRSKMNRCFFATAAGVLALAACSPGYMKASELESKHQGPSDCEARCVELGMRMGAFVLVSDTLPGCVCQPKPATVELPKPT